MEENVSFNDFLVSYPLYKKLEIDDYFVQPLKWYGLNFQFECDHEEGERTFKTVLEPDKFIDEFGFTKQSFQTEDGKINYILHVSGICQSCNQFKVHFLVHYFSDSLVKPYLHDNRRDLAFASNWDGIVNDTSYNPKFFVRKVGQIPSFSIKPDKEVEKFLDESDKEYYKKAITCISMSYGIAAYSYLRRIVETEVVRIVEYLIKLDTPEKEHIQAAYDEYKSKHQMDPFLIKIGPHLPKELKVLHENPLRVLYSELSLGIHAYEEEICLKNAETTNELLIFIIKALNSKERLKTLSQKMRDIGRK